MCGEAMPRRAVNKQNTGCAPRSGCALNAMHTTPHRRRFKLRIWWLALGYFAFYAPFSFLIKVLTTPLWPGINGPVSGFRILPAVAVSTASVLLAIITLDRKSTRLNSSHLVISYAVFCLNKKKYKLDFINITYTAV